MRHIVKPEQPPDSIRDYIINQTPVGHGLDYATFANTASPLGGSRGGQLCNELSRQQYGLCAYSGAGIDDTRLGKIQDPNARLKFSRHNEHLKPQSVCRNEMESAGRTFGIDLGEDMDHRNIVAALLVSGGGSKIACKHLFGAAFREKDPVPLLPTDPSCEDRFSFNIQGAISATDPADQPATETINALNLNYEVLRRWREQAIETWLEKIKTRADAEEAIERLANPTNGQLPEYCFAIRQLILSLVS